LPFSSLLGTAFYFLEIKKERTLMSFIYHNADSNKITHLLRIGLYLGYLH
jgi:hypothetical protein